MLSAEFVEATDPETAALIAAFWSYEAALMANDVPGLEGWFADAPETLRTDGAVSLVGYGEISAFRRGRPAPPARRVERLHLRSAGAGAVFVVAETRRADGGRGAQSQLWVKRPEGWRVTAAHVATAPPVSRPAVERGSIWRRVGSPLVAGAPDGPLAGTKVAVKDLFAVAGEQIGAGNPQWLAEAEVERETAPAVRALLDAGAQVTGIAQTDEFAFSLAGVNIHYGTPENAAAPGCITGGSSSGPAAAVAGGLADLGLGTDTAGSIRVPASYCGLYGIRPTHGAIDRTGLLPLAPSFDTVGLLARDPNLLRRAANTLLPQGEPSPVTTLLVASDLLALVDPPMRLAFVAAVRALAGRAGLAIRIVAALCHGRLNEWFAAFRTAQAAEAWAAHGEWIQAHPGSLDAPIEARFTGGRDTGEEQRVRAEEVLTSARKSLHEQIPPGTAIALPASSSTAPPKDLAIEVVEEIRAATLRLTCLASLAGLPAVVAPTLRVGTRPAGLCLVGAPGSDDALLSLLEGCVVSSPLAGAHPRQRMNPLGPTSRNTWQASEHAIDLRRPIVAPAPITVRAEPQRLTLDLARTALVVVDMQNDFCDPGGWLASIGVDVSGARQPIPVIAALLPALRGAGVPVIWLNWGNRPDRANLPPNVLHVYDPAGEGVGIGSPLPGSGAPVLELDSWAAAVVDGLEVSEEDIHVAKYRMSGFFDTPLDSILRNLRVDTVLFAGVNADQCVLATLTDAACLGYDVVMLEDAVGTTSPEFCMQATVYNVRQCFGFTAGASDLLAAMDSTS